MKLYLGPHNEFQEAETSSGNGWDCILLVSFRLTPLHFPQAIQAKSPDALVEFIRSNAESTYVEDAVRLANAMIVPAAADPETLWEFQLGGGCGDDGNCGEGGKGDRGGY